MSGLNDTQHLLVDLDGTLLGARDLPLRLDVIFRSLRAFRRHGGWLRAAKALAAIRSELAKAPPEVVDDLTNDQRVAGAFAKALELPFVEAEKLLSDAIGGLFPSLKRHFYPIAEAKEFLDWAKDRFPMTLATDPVWPEHIVKLRLEWAGIEANWFRNITHAQIMHACKPTPEYYRETLNRFGLEPETSVLIGNDMKMDLPATRVGIRVFIVAKDTPEPKDLSIPGTTTPAWKGTFASLRSMLEESSRTR
jgi:FMN phosphatase YigB (HAD superfamily)